MVTMKSCFLSLILFILCSAVIGRNDFPSEVIVTSADVVDGEIKNVGKGGIQYRLYGIYALGSDESLVQQVSISDSAGQVFKLADLQKAGEHFLRENNIVVGPIKVIDPTPAQTQRSVTSCLTYTIYLVSILVPALPVANYFEAARQSTVNSDYYNGEEARGLTILSADAYFTLHRFNFTAASAYIIPRGYDVQSSSVGESVLNLTQHLADSSYITIFGPIATILNRDEKKGRVQIGFDVAPLDSPQSIKPGASLTLLSPNWLSIDQSYSTSYQSYSEAFDRQFSFGDYILVDTEFTLSGLKEDESLTIQSSTQAGDTMLEYDYNGTVSHVYQRDSFRGRDVHLSVVVSSPASPSTYPRFVLKVYTWERISMSTKRVSTTTSIVSSVSFWIPMLIVIPVLDRT